MKKNWLKIALIIIASVCTGYAAYLDNKLDQNVKKVKEGEQKIQTIEAQNTRLQINNNSIWTQMNKLKNIRDSLINLPQEDRVVYNYIDSVSITYKDSINFIDSVIIKEEIENTKPVWGSVIFSDTSNIFTDVNIIVDWPKGRRKITYKNKYTSDFFTYYAGIGYNRDKSVVITSDIFYGKHGLGIMIGKTQGICYKYKL